MPLDPIEEQKFAELRDKCRELNVPAPPNVFIGLKVKDKNGVLVFDDKQRGHSWTRNFYNGMAYSLASMNPTGSTYAAGSLANKNYAGAVFASYTQHALSEYIGSFGKAGDGVVDRGIVVGTDDTAFSTENYVLGTPIANGTSTGQFTYAAMETPTAAYDSTAGSEKWTATVERIMNNNSGASITVKETGLYYKGDGNYVMLMERSVLSPTVAVADGAQLTVTYDIEMDFSAID